MNPKPLTFLELSQYMSIPEEDVLSTVEFIEEEDGRYTAKDLEYGIASFGHTKEDARSSLKEAVKAYLAAQDQEVEETEGSLPWI